MNSSAKQRWREPPARRARRRGLWQLLRAPLLFLVWVAALAGLIEVLGWYDPIPKPRLSVITADPQLPLLPRNTFAYEDVLALANLADVFQGGQVSGPLMTAEEMRDEVDRWKEPWSLRGMFSRGKSVQMVYVNAPGVAVPVPGSSDHEPFIIPTQTQARVEDLLTGESHAVREHGLSVNFLLDQLARCPADIRVLVLDCQRAEVVWPLGVHGNAFVEAVQQLIRAREEELGNTHVLLSCSPGDVTWVDYASRHSVFGKAFLDGLRGAADGMPSDGGVQGTRDGRITLAELHHYTRHRVQDWVRQYRGDDQVPLLINLGASDPSSVLLTAVSASSDPAQSPEADSVAGDEAAAADAQAAAGAGAGAGAGAIDESTDAVLESFRQQWTRVFALRTRDPSPADLTPTLWREVRDQLLDAEHAARCQEWSRVRAQLDEVDDLLTQLEQPHVLDARGVGFSLPLLGLHGHDVTPVAPQPPGDETTKAASTAGPEPADGSPKAQTSASSASSEAAAPSSDPSDSGTNASSAAAGGDGNPDAAAESDAKPAAESGDGPQDETAGPLTVAEVAGVVDQVLRGGSVREAGQVLQRPVAGLPTLPVEAELLRMFFRFDALAGESASQAAGEESLRNLLKQRVELEQAVFAGGMLTPGVVPWVRDELETLDAAKRLQEDRFWSQSASSLLVSQDTSQAAPLAVNTVVSRSQDVARAIRVWNLALAELPYLVQFCSLRDWTAASDQGSAGAGAMTPAAASSSLREDVMTLTLGVLEQTAELTHNLSLDPTQLTPDDRVVRLGRIRGLTDSLLTARAELLERLTLESQALTASTEQSGAADGSNWRQLDALLTLPLAFGEQTEPATLAENRVRFLNAVLHSRTAVEPEGAPGNTVPTDSSEQTVARNRSQRSSQLRELGQAFYGLVTIGRQSDPAGADASSTGYSPELESTVREGVRTLAGHESKHAAEALFWRDVAARVFPSGLTRKLQRPDDVGTPSEARARDQLARLYGWLATRQMQDFWGNRDADEVPYFELTAGSYLDRARDPELAAGGIERFDDERDQLAERARLAARLELPGGDGVVVAEPAECRLVGVDAVQLRFGLQTPSPFSEGRVRISCRSPRDELGVAAAQAQAAESEVVAFEVSRVRDATLDSVVFADLFYRGHRSRLPIPVHVAGEFDGAAVTYAARSETRGQLEVRWSKVDRQASNVLFVLDCSRSMNEQNRLGILRDTLLQFARIAGDSGVRIGVRVFGDRVVWSRGNAESEAQARRDTRLLLPIQAFPGRRFAQQVSQLQARGETPLFYALIQAADDFDDAPAGDKLIVVISDGADNWAQVGEKPGITELEAAFRNRGIRINAIGFQTDAAGFDQLRQIAAVTGGLAVRAEQAQELLNRVFGLAEYLQYSLFRRAETGRRENLLTRPLEADPEPIPVAPGRYDVDVTGISGNLAARRYGIEIAAGAHHELLYLGNRLGYPEPRLLQDVAFVRDEQSGVILRVLSAVPSEENGLQLELGLLKPSDPNWAPPAPIIRVRPRGTARIYTLAHLEPNGVGRHFPSWKFLLENWPADVDFAEVSVSWSASTGSGPAIVVPWGGASQSELEEGMRITRKQYQSFPLGGRSRAAARVTLVAPPRQLREHNWTFQFDSPVTWARYGYNTADGVYSGYFELQDAQPPREFSLVGSPGPDQQTTLSTIFDVRLRKIN